MAATCLIVGQVVGIGIFLTPAEMARGLAAPGLVQAMWLLVGFMALTGALCYGELAPAHAGGLHRALRPAAGVDAGGPIDVTTESNLTQSFCVA